MKIHTIVLLAILAGFVLWELIFVKEECVLPKQADVPAPTVAPYQTCYAYCKSIAPECTCPTAPPVQECPEPEECPFIDIPSCPPAPACPTSIPCNPCQECIEKPTNEYPAGLFRVKRTNPRPIIDVFSFWHELDWLEIRLNELKDVVDFFVLMEGQVTPSHVLKPMFYFQNKDRYQKLADKIIYVNCTVDDTSLGAENQTSACLQRGIQMAIQKLAEKNMVYQNSDLIIMNSDVDELPRRDMVQTWRWFDPMAPLPGLVSLRFHYYSFHWQIMNSGWQGTSVTNYQLMIDNPQTTWNWHGTSTPNIPVRTHFNEGGWHCRNCLTPQDLQYRIQTFANATELSTPELTDLNHLNDSIENGRDWAGRPEFILEPTNKLGDLPKYLLQNMDKFPYLVPLSKYEKFKVLEAALNFLDDDNLWSAVTS